MATKRRRIARTRTIQTNVQTERTKLERQVRKEVAQANQRLKSLERRYKRGTWASKKLMNRLDSGTLNAWQRGRIKVGKNLTSTQLRAIDKATRQFLESKTSTKKGIRETSQKTKESIKSTLSEDMRDRVSDEDAEFYYDMLGDNDFDYFSDKIGASTLWVLIDEAIDNSDSESAWLSRLSSYIELNDLDVRDRAVRLYDKYVI